MVYPFISLLAGQTVNPFQVLIRQTLIKSSVFNIGSIVISLSNLLSWHARDHGVRWEMIIFSHDRIAGDNRPSPNFRAVHDGRVDPDQTAVLDGATVQGDMVRDRAILPHERSCAVALMDHHEILNIAAGANPDFIQLRSCDRIGPDRGFRPYIDLPVQPSGLVDKTGLIQNYVGPNCWNRHSCLLRMVPVPAALHQ